MNFLDRVPILPPVRAELRDPFSDDLAPLMLQTLDLPELAATKTLALARRQAPRDLFDIALLVQRDAAPWSSVRTLVVVRGAAYPPPSPAEYQAAAVDRVSTAAWRSEVVSLARRPLPVQIEEARAIGVATSSKSRASRTRTSDSFDFRTKDTSVLSCWSWTRGRENACAAIPACSGGYGPDPWGSRNAERRARALEPDRAQPGRRDDGLQRRRGG